MSEKFEKTLEFEDSLAVIKLGSSFAGSDVAKFTALKLNERIADVIRKNTKTEPAFDENKKPILDEKNVQKVRLVPPTTIKLEISRQELDGFFIGVKETVKAEGITTSDVTTIGYICSILGMNKRFIALAEATLKKIERDESPLDSEVIEEPLD